MHKYQKPNILRKALLSFMTFAFFYLVIGDLIMVHQKSIFNYDAYADQTIVKPHKNGKKDSLKLGDQETEYHINLLTFVSGTIDYSEINGPIFKKHIKCACFSVGLTIARYPSYNFRGPPRVL